MQIIDRKVDSKITSTIADTMKVDIVDGRRMSIRVESKTGTRETVVNFTGEQTRKIKSVLSKTIFSNRD